MTTTLDVINACLDVIGEQPITDPNSLHPSAIKARTVLGRVSKACQARSTGWWYNTEYRLDLQPDINGFVNLPANVLKVKPTNERDPFVQRGLRYYDPKNHTFVIGRAVKSFLTIQFPLEDCPESMGDWILKQTAYEFYRNDDGDANKAQSLLADSMRAEVEVKKEHTSSSGLNAQNRIISRLLFQRVRGPFGTIGGGTDPHHPGG